MVNKAFGADFPLISNFFYFFIFLPHYKDVLIMKQRALKRNQRVFVLGNRTGATLLPFWLITSALMTLY